MDQGLSPRKRAAIPSYGGTHGDPDRELKPWTPQSTLKLHDALLAEEDDVFSIASPAHNTRSVISSPFVRPIAPKALDHKSPPPVVLDRRAESSKRRRPEMGTFQALEDVSDGQLLGLPRIRLDEDPADDAGASSPLVPCPAVRPLEVSVLGPDCASSTRGNAGGDSPVMPVPCERTLSRTSIESWGSRSLLSIPSSLRSSSLGPFRAADTPPCASEAFEVHETLVKCPAPKRSRLACTVPPDKGPKKFSFDDF